MYATRLCAALLAAMTSMLLVAARPASAETFTIDFFPDDTQINNTIQLRFLGPNTGQVTQTRLFIDFTTAAGWNNTWALSAGAITTWTFSASGWSGGDGVTSPFFVEGAVMASASRMGQITP